MQVIYDGEKNGERKMQVVPARGEVFCLVLWGSRCYGAGHALRVSCGMEGEEEL